MSIADKYTTLNTEKIPQVYEAGKNAEYETFWNEVLQGGERTQFRYAFGGLGWTDVNFKPPTTIRPSDSRYMFCYSGITNLTDEQVDFEDATDLRDCFYYCLNLETLILKISGKAKTFDARTFQECANLANLTIIGGTISKNGLDLQWSTKLTKDSLVSVFNALSTTTSGLSITLSKVAVNNAFGINVDNESTYPEGSPYYQLRHSRDNWSINYI